MSPTRREFIKTTGVLGTGLALGGLGACAQTDSTPDSTSKRILIFGGTGLIGPNMVEYAVQRGHQVSIFSRGRAEDNLPESVERLIGDRNPDEVPLAWTLDGETVIPNAGVVLVAPFLPRLFATLGLTDQGAFRDLEAAGRGAHLIQYLVEGRGDRPEYLLPLNRILCGIPEDEPLPRRIEISPVEAETIQEMLSAIIEQWGALGSTSVPGLQESFLQRRGALRAGDERWRLQVEGKAFDVLLDRLPWSYAIIHFRWMPLPLHVEWR